MVICEKRKTFDFLMSLGAIKRENWERMSEADLQSFTKHLAVRLENRVKTIFVEILTAEFVQFSSTFANFYFRK